MTRRDWRMDSHLVSFRCEYFLTDTNLLNRILDK